MPGGENTRSKAEVPSGFRLDGVVAVVTGAGGSLGAALSWGLAQMGAQLILLGRSREKLEKVAARIEGGGGSASTHTFDLTDSGGIQRFLSPLAEKQAVQVLVNAAGIQLRKPALEITSTEWDEIMAVNLKAAFFCCQAVAPSMIRRGGGSIINISSLTGSIGLPHLAAYGASKGGLEQMTRALAVEWAPHRVRVNAIAPGRIRTPMTESLFQDATLHQSFLSRIPLGRAGRPEDLVGAAVYLASPASEYLTGQVLCVDGGWLASGGNPDR